MSSKSSRRRAFALALLLAHGATQHGLAVAAEGELKLHLPSPDWRDQVIYFVMIDRFADGDRSNNDQGAGEFDPASNARYSGGDLRGLQQRLDYVQGLGASAVWITPPVAHQWWDPVVNYGGYHGYWASDFKAVDAHFGSLDDYRQLSHALHSRGMYLIQDVVVNHVGNWFGYPGAWTADDPTTGYRAYRDAPKQPSPAQALLQQNDPRDPAHRKAAIYHWTPTIRDFQDADQEFNFQLADLDDLNTENPQVRRLLRDSYGYWIREVGVDAFRVDTAYYVPPEFFEDFLHADDAEAPGVLATARASGRERFHVFGEGFGIDRHGEDHHSRKILSYIRGERGEARMPGMLNFPLYGSLLDVFARGRPSRELAQRIESVMTLFPEPHLLPSFVDNHDVDRFLAGGSEAALKQSLLAILTLPGIPTIYYGTEQGFREQRAAMFGHGYGSAGRDHFDPEAPLYRFLREAIALRRTHPLFSRGVPTIIADNGSAPGVLGWRIEHDGERALVLFNSSDAATLAAPIDTGLPAGSRLTPLLAIDATAPSLQVDADGHLHRELAASSGEVWKVEAPTPLPTRATAIAPRLDALPDQVLQDDFTISGRGKPDDALRLVIDGDLDHAQTVRVNADGRWSALLDTASFADPAIGHRLVAWSPALQRASAAQSFRIERAWRTVAEVDDPAGDDHGPQGRYRYPTDPGWGANRQLDLRRIRVDRAGSSLRIDIELPSVTRGWNPPNGFDRVAFTLFIELPGRDGGSRVLPLQNAELPEGMRWHYRLRSHGWSNAWFSADQASATHEGRAATPGVAIRADAGARRVRIEIPASALGKPGELSGARLYLATWDYDSGFKPLQPEAAAHAFGGGEGAVDPLVMDASAVITLP